MFVMHVSETVRQNYNNHILLMELKNFREICPSHEYSRKLAFFIWSVTNIRFRTSKHYTCFISHAQ